LFIFAPLDEAEVLIAPVHNGASDNINIKKQLNHLSVNDSVLKVCTVEVPLTKPLTRSQYKQASKLWPVNFHEDKQ